VILRAAAGLLAAVITFVASAAPAAAHGGPGGSDPPASNYRSVIRSVEPELDGLRLRIIDAGARVELVNRTGEDVVVLGYEGEPYLRIGPDGVFENQRSPATYLNRDRQADTEVPADADPEAEPEWRRLDDGPSARWHDHRAHWMGTEPPPGVAAEPDRSHTVIDAWEIPLRVGEDDVVVSGRLDYVPGPSGWPWLAGGAAAVAVIAALGQTRWWRWTIVVVAATLVAASILDVVGVWWATSERSLAKAGELAAPLLAGTVLLGALPVLWRAPRDALLLVTAGAAGFGLLFGVTGLDWLTRSQIPSGLDPTVARATVIASAAGAVGILATAATRLPALAAVTPARTARPVTPAPQELAVDLRRERTVLLVGLAVILVLFAFAVSGEPDTDPTANDPQTQEGP
jgi:hypothetical protein